MLVEVHWRVSRSASCCHAAEAIAHQRHDIDARLDAALRGPAEQLQCETVMAGVPEDDFWEHLVPLAAQIDNNRLLIDAVLRKTVGVGGYAESLVAVLARWLAELEAAGQSALPDLFDELSRSSEHLRQQWDLYGPSLLHQLALLTDERLLVNEATIDLVYPALGGGGRAHLNYNTARIEVVEQDLDPELPEIVRLAWLVGQLNTDLPGFSETILRKRQHRLAKLALLPAVLTAGEELGLTPPGASAWMRAARLWQVDGGLAAELTDVLGSWWESYLEMRPPWNVALGALDQMAASTAE
jgi:hypothetical protein